ncbi:MAG: NAD-binding protein [Jatrophihabitantaceae bacterium]
MNRSTQLRAAISISALNLVLPRREHGPGRLLLRRLWLALGLLAVATAAVFIQRRGYQDGSGHPMGIIDSLYFATVSLSTTGYGDVVPVSTSARVVNIVLITPLRLMFLLVLVGTTIEVLTTSVNQRARARRWRNHVKNHVVIIGYGTKGRAAAAALVDAGTPIEQIAVIDLDPRSVQQAADDGATAICGDASRTAVLAQVSAARAARIVIATDRDDSSVLIALTVRQTNTDATVVAAVRHAENAPLLRSAGADSVVVSAEAAGRLLGISANSPATGDLVTDLLDASTGREIAERPATSADLGKNFAPGSEVVLGVVRDGGIGEAEDGMPITVQPGDKLVVVRRASRA